MRINSSRVFVILALIFAVVPAAMAQQTAEQTGAIEGTVLDAQSAVLPGVTVEVTGPAGTFSTVTDGNGQFRFPRLPSGRYTIRTSIKGFRPGVGQVDLNVGTTARADFTLPVAGVAETVEVTAQVALVDLTSSAVGTNIARERIDMIPRGRDFTSVIGQAPGARQDEQAGGITIDGASGAENRFVIDGVDTTHPQTGVSAMPLRAELVEEVQVKSAGYEAEFGGSTGGVINVLTRSGTNEWHGGFLVDFQDRSWGGDQRPLLRQSLTSNTQFVYVEPPKDDVMRTDPGFTLGGPILRNRLWFFGAYLPGFSETERTVNFTNGVTNTFPQEFRIHYTTFSVRGNAGNNLLYRTGASFSPYEENGVRAPQDGRTSLTQISDWARGEKGSRNSASGSLDYAGSRMVLSGRVGYFGTNRESTGVTFPSVIHEFSTGSLPTGIAALPEQFRRQLGFRSDVLVTDATTQDKYTRNYVGGDATWYGRAAGEHQIKGGVQAERIGNDVLTGYNGDRILYYAGRPYQAVSTNQAVQGTFGYFRLLNISTLGEVESWNTALFIQDNWRVNSRLTLNIGLRSEYERVPNYGAVGPQSPISFGFGQKLAPRLGFAWDPVGDLRWKVYGSFGKYFDVMKYEMPRGAFGGDKWVDYFYTWDSPDFTLNSAATCTTGTNTSTERPVCPGGRLIEALDRRHNSADPADPTLEPNLKPMEEREFQLGVNRELNWQGLVVGARYVRQELVRTIEDIGITTCTSATACAETFYIANPGEGIALSLQTDPRIPAFPKAVRDYDALELTLQRRFADRWSWFANYTISRLWGNYSGLASSDENSDQSTSEGGQVVVSGARRSPNVNRFFDHIENSFDRNGNLVFGRLATDRPHRFSTSFNYLFDFNLNVGLHQFVQSGAPVSEEATVGATVPFFPHGRGNLGRTDICYQTDLLLNQTFRFSRYDMQIGVTVLNLFDQQAVIRRFKNRILGNLPLSTLQFFQGGWDYESLASNPALVEPRFNQPEVYQMPRELRVTAKFNF